MPRLAKTEDVLPGGVAWLWERSGMYACAYMCVCPTTAPCLFALLDTVAIHAREHMHGDRVHSENSMTGKDSPNLIHYAPA